MKRISLLAITAVPCAVFGAQDASANCPAAYRTFSSETPLLDLMINPAATEIVERDVPGFLSSLPKMLTGTTPPTLADILSIRIMATVPLKLESAKARCARYDQTPPDLPKALPHPAILVFSKSNGFRDHPSVNAAKAALTLMGERRHWSLFFTDNAAVFNAEALKRFDGVVWNTRTGQAGLGRECGVDRAVIKTLNRLHSLSLVIL